MKILLIDSNYPINTRNVKIADFFRKKGTELIVCTWLRQDIFSNLKKHDKEYVFECPSELGKRYTKLFNLYKYFKYLKQVNDIEKPNVLICSHYDMLFLGYFLKSKNQTLVYENLDIPTHSNKVVLKILQFIEQICLRKTDFVSLASRFYLDLYSNFKKNIVVLENIPNFDESPVLIEKQTKKKVVSFIGGVRYIEILKKMIAFSAQYNNIEVRIYGEGHESKMLEEFLNKNSFTHVFVKGRYDYSEIGKFYSESDYIWAVYPKDNYNVRYAISNKFHESLYFKRPGIYATDTSLGNYVIDNQLGLTVDYNDEPSLHKLFSCISEDDYIYRQLLLSIETYRKNNNVTWNDGMSRFNDILVELYYKNRYVK